MGTDWVEVVHTWAEKFDIKAVLFDLDDTLVKVRTLFFRRMDEAVDFVCSNHPEIDKEFLRKRQREINTEGYMTYAVNPVRWDYVYKRLAQEFSGVEQDTWDKALEITYQIYRDVPEVFEGTHELLSYLREAGVMLILVTHASEEWTEFKLHSTGLGGYFEKVVCISPDSFKTFEAWVRAANVADTNVEKTAVVGDNLNGDIVSARQAGVPHLFWIDSGDGWIHYRKGTPPEGTKIIKEVKELLGCIRETVLA